MALRVLFLAALLCLAGQAHSFNIATVGGALDLKHASALGTCESRLRGGETVLDEIKIENLRAIGASLRRGGYGTARRKFKVVRQKASKADEAKFQSALKRANINAVTGMGDVEMFNNDGSIFYFKSPKVYCNAQANAFVVHGDYEIRRPPTNYGNQAVETMPEGNEEEEQSAVENFEEQAEAPVDDNAA